MHVPVDGLPRVLRHLVRNSLRFSLPGKPVVVTGRSVGASYELTVADQGRGMTPEQINQMGVFQQFGRDKQEQQGIGVGLALARSFVELCGGKFQLLSNSPQSGVTACLAFPTASLSA